MVNFTYFAAPPGTNAPYSYNSQSTPNFGFNVTAAPSSTDPTLTINGSMAVNFESSAQANSGYATHINGNVLVNYLETTGLAFKTSDKVLLTVDGGFTVRDVTGATSVLTVDPAPTSPSTTVLTVT